MSKEQFGKDGCNMNQRKGAQSLEFARAPYILEGRSEERRVGKECYS